MLASVFFCADVPNVGYSVGCKTYHPCPYCTNQFSSLHRPAYPPSLARPVNESAHETIHEARRLTIVFLVFHVKGRCDHGEVLQYLVGRPERHRLIPESVSTRTACDEGYFLTTGIDLM